MQLTPKCHSLKSFNLQSNTIQTCKRAIYIPAVQHIDSNVVALRLAHAIHPTTRIACNEISTSHTHIAITITHSTVHTATLNIENYCLFNYKTFVVLATVLVCSWRGYGF